MIPFLSGENPIGSPVRKIWGSSVAARAAGLAHWQPGLNVNRFLATELGDAFGWLAHPVFTALLGETDAA
ncbi:MAG TPA: hypothetical protein VFQ44_28935 [Streptosporangiaceae bacterium]|nr:hypothetical protein [Streptosporangiaceae bacterium]